MGKGAAPEGLSKDRAVPKRTGPIWARGACHRARPRWQASAGLGGFAHSTDWFLGIELPGNVLSGREENNLHGDAAVLTMLRPPHELSK
jgi:hypothetical protein